MSMGRAPGATSWTLPSGRVTCIFYIVLSPGTRSHSVGEREIYGSRFRAAPTRFREARNLKAPALCPSRYSGHRSIRRRTSRRCRRSAMLRAPSRKQQQRDSDTGERERRWFGDVGKAGGNHGRAAGIVDVVVDIEILEIVELADIDGRWNAVANHAGRCCSQPHNQCVGRFAGKGEIPAIFVRGRPGVPGKVRCRSAAINIDVVGNVVDVDVLDRSGICDDIKGDVPGVAVLNAGQRGGWIHAEAADAINGRVELVIVNGRGSADNGGRCQQNRELKQSKHLTSDSVALVES